MRDPNRQLAVLTILENVWRNYPDMRLGQLLSCAAHGKDLFYIEDDELVTKLVDFFSQQERN